MFQCWALDFPVSPTERGHSSGQPLPEIQWQVPLAQVDLAQVQVLTLTGPANLLAAKGMEHFEPRTKNVYSTLHTYWTVSNKRVDPGRHHAPPPSSMQMAIMAMNLELYMYR